MMAHYIKPRTRPFLQQKFAECLILKRGGID